MIFVVLALAALAGYVHDQLLGFAALADLSTLSADNGLRLQEVRDLVGGQAWFDTRQYRYLPPEGTAMHWSRLVDAPLAAFALLTPAFGNALAERLMLAFWPALLFTLYCGLSLVALSRSFGMRAALLGVAVAPTYLAFRDLFGAGEIDHHNVQVVLTLGSVLSFAAAGARPRCAILGGAASALSLAVGLETLPFVATIGACYALAFVIDARQARAFAFFATTLALASLAAFLAQTAPSLWFAASCDTLSSSFLLLTFGAGAVALVATASGARFATWQARAAPLVVGGAAVLAAFALLFPECLAGPYGAVPESVRKDWLELTGEAYSLREFLTRFPTRAAIVFGPTLVAALAAWLGAFRVAGEGRRLLLAAAALLTLTLLLSVVQIRAIYVGCAMIPIVAAFVFDRAIGTVTRGAAPSRAIALILACVLFFELPWIAAAGAFAPHGKPAARDMRACLEELPALRRQPPGTILAPLNLGAHVLFMTDQAIVAAGYHRNVEGIVAGVEAFSGAEEDLRRFAARDGADYVALCLPWIAAHPDRYGDFAEALARGAAAPAWLVPVPLGTHALKLWRAAP